MYVLYILPFIHAKLRVHLMAVFPIVVYSIIYFGLCDKRCSICNDITWYGRTCDKVTSKNKLALSALIRLDKQPRNTKVFILERSDREKASKFICIMC